ncbi:MAG: hypothetical protein WC998_03490 [Candidatus Paceibacterota bacterium]
MGYPKHYVGRYGWLAKWLEKQGFKVYPMEMFCKSVQVETKLTKEQMDWRLKTGRFAHKYQYLYGNVDVVAWKDGKLWAFEVKNKGDKVKTALLQTKNYAECFDYSCIVADDLKELTKYRAEFRALGVGTYHWFKGEACLLDAPKLQMPDEVMYKKLYQRFLRNTGMVKKENPFNKSLRSLFPEYSEAEIKKIDESQKSLSQFFTVNP